MIEQKFIELCDNYFSDKDIFAFSYESNKKSCIFKAELRLIKIEFCYIKKSNIQIPPSTLYCRIYLNKNSIVYYHLTDILAELHKKDFRSCYFSFIENPHRMELCFNRLTNILDTHMAEIEGLILNGIEIQENLFDTYRNMFKLKEKDLDFSLIEDEKDYAHGYFQSLQNFRDNVLVNHFTTMDTYNQFLLGNVDRSIKLYGKMSKRTFLLPYEQELYNFLNSADSIGFVPMPEECFSQKSGMKQSNLPFSELIKFFLVAYIPFAVIFCIVFAIVNLILSRDAVFLFGASWYFGLIPATFCGIFGAIAFRNKIRWLLYKDSALQAIEIDKVDTSNKEEIFIRCVFGAALAVAVFFSVLLTMSYAKFYDNQFTYCNDEGLISYSTYSYEDIYEVYHINAFYNEFGDRIERPSYVIVLKDGAMLYLDGYTSVKKSEETVIPFLQEKGFEVVKLDSDKNLPF